MLIYLFFLLIHKVFELVLCGFQLKMVLIKCCDISNEVRPMEVSEPWVDCLLEEYFNQVRSFTRIFIDFPLLNALRALYSSALDAAILPHLS